MDPVFDQLPEYTRNLLAALLKALLLELEKSGREDDDLYHKTSELAALVWTRNMMEDFSQRDYPPKQMEMDLDDS